MRINYVIPGIGPSYTGGMLCIYEYINGLVERGHEVTVVPLMYAGPPPFLEIKGKVIASIKPATKVGIKIKSLLTKTLCRNTILKLKKLKACVAKDDDYVRNRFAMLADAIGRISDCEANIATSYETALAVYYSGKGTPFYFMQHFEEYFCNESPVPDFSKRDAALSYILPLNKIANSSWLKNTFETYYPEQKVTAIVNNAIRTEIFYPRDVKKDNSKIRIVSYGGRNAIWKGFREAAFAIRKVRAKYPEIDWLVYGGALLPADNEIAPYRDMGYVTGERLAEIYSMGDIMVCPSWYESFPLFPLEAMACGLAVVTTPYGTEDYAKNENNCLVCQPKDTESLSKAIIRLIENKTLRQKLALNGIETAKQFTWQRSITKLEEVLERYVV